MPASHPDLVRCAGKSAKGPVTRRAFIWTGVDDRLTATLALVNTYLRPGGCLVFSGEHPVYSCLEWNGAQYAVSVPYFTEGPREHTSWKGVPIVIQRRTLGAFFGQIVQAGLRV